MRTTVTLLVGILITLLTGFVGWMAYAWCLGDGSNLAGWLGIGVFMLPVPIAFALGGLAHWLHTEAGPDEWTYIALRNDYDSRKPNAGF